MVVPEIEMLRKIVLVDEAAGCPSRRSAGVRRHDRLDELVRGGVDRRRERVRQRGLGEVEHDHSDGRLRQRSVSLTSKHQLAVCCAACVE